MWVPSLGPEDPLENGMASHSSILACSIPWTEEPGGLQSMGLQRVRGDWNDLACTHPFILNPYNILGQHWKQYPISFAPLEVLYVFSEFLSSLFSHLWSFKILSHSFSFPLSGFSTYHFPSSIRAFIPLRFTFLYKCCISPICLVFLDGAPESLLMYYFFYLS